MQLANRYRCSNRRFLALWVCSIVWCIAASSVIADPVPPKISAESAILVDAITGKVLYEKACRVKRPPASTTKIMTAILALENGKLDDTVQVTKKASETRFSSLHLKAGETLTLHDLLYGLLLRSANDGAVCTAEHIAGSEKEFVKLMNEKAAEIGAKDTHFVNPHGLHNAKHYTTAYDLALIARHAIQLPVFNDIVQTKTKRIERSINDKDVYLKNTARFLWRCEGADGIKTGYTREAGKCFVGSATRDDWRVITVVLKCSDAGADAEALLDYAFKYFRQVSLARKDKVVATVPVVGGVEQNVDLIAADDLSLVLRRKADAQTEIDMDIKHARAPFVKGQRLGTLTGYVNGEKLGTVDLLAGKSVDRTLAATMWYFVRSTFFVLTLFVVAYLSYGTAAAKVARRRRRRVKARG